ncbi:helix-turn-helix domain-containing protein [Hugenholtzia roseola]|uniref:helix-turn-helix domain-containing protein n=1 Tax=Hugenholtzia roseola TaxID=1002 RepID=UPI0012B61CC4|nr:helix-turn-helix transcriptional regulator [Hugenholtzia roseola]
MKMRVGQRLLTFRQERKLRQVEMAELLGVSPATYSRIERDESSLEFEQIIRIAQTLEVSVQDFLPESLLFRGFLDKEMPPLSEKQEKEISTVCLLERKLKLKEQENQFLQEKIAFLEKELERLHLLLEQKKTIS